MRILERDDSMYQGCKDRRHYYKIYFNCWSNYQEKIELDWKSKFTTLAVQINEDKANIKRCDYYVLSYNSDWNDYIVGLVNFTSGKLWQSCRHAAYYNKFFIYFFFGDLSKSNKAYSSLIWVIIYKNKN